MRIVIRQADSGGAGGTRELHSGVVLHVEHGPHPSCHQEGAAVPQLGHPDRRRERQSQVICRPKMLVFSPGFKKIADRLRIRLSGTDQVICSSLKYSVWLDFVLLDVRFRIRQRTNIVYSGLWYVTVYTPCSAQTRTE